jgi:hypothetical protein
MTSPIPSNDIFEELLAKKSDLTSDDLSAFMYYYSLNKGLEIWEILSELVDNSKVDLKVEPDSEYIYTINAGITYTNCVSCRNGVEHSLHKFVRVESEEEKEYEHEHDSVNHPKHYTSHPSGVECIAITRHMGFNLGNALKYIWRVDDKDDPIEQLEKAIWYLQDEIKKRKGLI